MREILFKAKRIDNGEWEIGSLVALPNGDYEIANKCQNPPDSDPMWKKCVITHKVDPSTICQCTGLTDKNGQKIWENDVLSIARKSDCMGGYYYPPIQYPVNIKVRWDMCAWVWETIGERKYYISFPDAWCHYEAEVIGNIFDNPELINE